jgi:hypothetical protein
MTSMTVEATWAAAAEAGLADEAGLAADPRDLLEFTLPPER